MSSNSCEVKSIIVLRCYDVVINAVEMHFVCVCIYNISSSGMILFSANVLLALPLQCCHKAVWKYRLHGLCGTFTNGTVNTLWYSGSILTVEGYQLRHELLKASPQSFLKSAFKFQHKLDFFICFNKYSRAFWQSSSVFTS